MTIPTEPIGSIPRLPELIDAGPRLASGQVTAGAYARLAEEAVRETLRSSRPGLHPQRRR